MPDAETINTSPESRGQRLRANSHIHLPPNFSAFDSVQQAVALAAEQDVRILGVSNYYDYTVYGDFAERARAASIFPLYGIEIIALLEDLQARGVRLNDPGNPGKMYICGKGITRFDPMTAEAATLLDVIRRKDSERIEKMVVRLAEVFESGGVRTALDVEAVKEAVVRRHGSPRETVSIQERHVAQAFQEALFESISPADRQAALERLFGVPSKAGPEDAVGIQNELRSQLMKSGRPAYVPETFVGFDHAYALILALGGIPCYPTLADGSSAFCEFEQDVEQLIGEIRTSNIHFAEFIPVRNRPEVLSRYAVAMRAAGIVVTAGTEHNTLDLLPMEPTCLNGEPIPDVLKDLFYEGACVIAAHQESGGAGESGFVDRDGRPNSAYGSAEERIAAFRRKGEEIVRRAIAGGDA